MSNLLSSHESPVESDRRTEVPHDNYSHNEALNHMSDFKKPDLAAATNELVKNEMLPGTVLTDEIRNMPGVTASKEPNPNPGDLNPGKHPAVPQPGDANPGTFGGGVVSTPEPGDGCPGDGGNNVKPKPGQPFFGGGGFFHIGDKKEPFVLHKAKPMTMELGQPQ